MSSSVNNRRSGNTNSNRNARLQIKLESLDLNLQSYIYSKVVQIIENVTGVTANQRGMYNNKILNALYPHLRINNYSTPLRNNYSTPPSTPVKRKIRRRVRKVGKGKKVKVSYA